MYKQSYRPFLEVTNYNPLNNLKSNNGNYIYYKYSNTLVDSNTEFIHKIDTKNIAKDVDINVLFCGGGGAGGSANKRSGGGAGGGGGEVLLSKFKLSNINNNTLKFTIGNVATQTKLYNVKSAASYVANYGKKGGNGSSKKGDGGDSYNGLPKRTIDTFTSGLGSGVGGAGGGYTNAGKNGSTANLATGVTGARIGNSIRDPYYITINLNDGTGNINTSFGGRGNQGQEDGYDGAPGYVLVYYIVNNNIQNNLDNTFYFGYNPIGKYFPVNYTNNIQEWCYIYLNTPGVVDQNTINNINTLIGNNSYNILAVGGGGGGGKYIHLNNYNQPYYYIITTDFYGGGGGAGGGCKHFLNVNSNINGLITSITIGNTGLIEQNGTDTSIIYSNSLKNIISGGGGAGYSCKSNYNVFLNTDNDKNMDKYRSFGGYNGSSYILYLHNINDALYNNTNNYNQNSIFSPAGGAAIGLNILLNSNENNSQLSGNVAKDYNIQSGNQIDLVMKDPIKLIQVKDSSGTTHSQYTTYEVYKGDIPHYIGEGGVYYSDYIKNNNINRYVNLPRQGKNYVGAFGKGYYQDKSPDGLMTRTEVNSNYDSTASPYRNGNIITYNFNNKVLSDTNTDTNIIISKGGNGGDLRYKRQGSGNDGEKGSPGFVLIWFKSTNNVLF